MREAQYMAVRSRLGGPAAFACAEGMSVPSVKISVVDAAGAERDLMAGAGEVLMETLRDNVDFGIGVCGGVMSCGTCRVVLDPAWRGCVPAANEAEIEMLDMLGEEIGARLACQIKLEPSLDGLRFTLAGAS